MSEIHGNITLQYSGERVDYILDVGIDVEKNIKFMPSLSFYHNYGMIEDEHLIDVWDNEDYLIDVLLNNVLVPWVEFKDVKVSNEFAELLQIDGVKLDDFAGMKKLLEKGIELGFFEEYFTKKKENDTGKK